MVEEEEGMKEEEEEEEEEGEIKERQREIGTEEEGGREGRNLLGMKCACTGRAGRQAGRPNRAARLGI